MSAGGRSGNGAAWKNGMCRGVESCECGHFMGCRAAQSCAAGTDLSFRYYKLPQLLVSLFHVTI